MSTCADVVKLARGEACPVCGSGANPHRRNTLCHKSADGTVVFCGKSSGQPHGGVAPFGHGKKLWFYRVGERPSGYVPRRRTAERRRRRVNFDRLFAGWWRAVNPTWLADHAAELGVSVDSLRRLGIGWADAAWSDCEQRHLIVGTPTPCRMPGTWVFPMRDGAGAIVGARVRTGRGSKYAIDGTDGDGILIPAGLRAGGTLMLPEGPTDAAALLTLGFDAVGRPANRGGEAAIAGLIRRLRPRRVIVVAENDGRLQDGVWREPAMDGARETAAKLGDAEILLPPSTAKDVREWVRAGAKTADVQAWIEGATR